MRLVDPGRQGRRAAVQSPSDPCAASLLMGIWFGAVTGLLEVGLRVGQQLWNHRVTLESIRTNHHWMWMAAVSDILIFGACGLLLAALVRFRPRPVSRIAPYLFCFLAFLALLLTKRGLYPIAYVVLAGGLAARTAPLIEAHSSRFRRMVRFSTPLLAGVVAVVAGIAGSHVSLHERRARTNLPAALPGSPNIVLIVMDDVRIDDLTVYGYKRNTTPNLARLARRALRFDQAWSSAPWTLPSHASMFTGRWPHELSVRVDRPLDATFPTIAEFLSRHGYATAAFVGNTFYCNSWYGLDRGFAHYEDVHENRIVSFLETLRASTLGVRLAAGIGLESAVPGATPVRKTAATISSDALDWLKRQENRPFFVFLNYYDAHVPFQPPAGFDVRFGLCKEPLAFRKSLLQSYYRLQFQENPPADALAIVENAAELLRDSYDTCIAYLDDELGRFFAQLDRRGLLDNTLVIVTSDHGEQFHEHDLFGHGNSLYGSLIHVPLLILPPRAKPTGRIVASPVSLRSVAATLADVTGLGKKSPFPGQSLARFWAAESGPVAADAPVLAEVEHQAKYPPNPRIPASLGPLQALVVDQQLYIHNSDGREELYDFEHDPAELRNLAGAPDAPPLLKRFREDLARHLPN